MASRCCIHVGSLVFKSKISPTWITWDPWKMGHLKDVKHRFTVSVYVWEFLSNCGGERGSLGHLPRVCGHNH